MKNKYAATAAICLMLLILVLACSRQCNVTAAEPNLPGLQVPAAETKDPDSPVALLLSDMSAAAQKIRTCRASLDYLVVQCPDILDARILRKGALYYRKDAAGTAVLIEFETVQQDDEPQRRRLERYFFDGVWLTKTDYELKQTQKFQQAPSDKPIDALEFIGCHFPIVGFSGAADLEKKFEVSICPPAPQDRGRKHLLLKVGKESSYRDEYTQADIWVEGKTSLPGRITSVSTQGDRYEIDFNDVRLNEKLPDGIFNISVPADFQVDVKPLDNENQ